MEAAHLGVTGLLVLGVLGLSLLLVSMRRKLVVARAEAELLRTMVKERVERPNVFSHEVRTPLALILGAVELLAEETPGPLNERQREFVATISSNADRVAGLAEDMLTEAKIDASLFELRMDRVDLRQVIRKIVRDARRVHGRPIVMDGAGPPLLLLGDPELLTQAVWNIVNNACRHAGDNATIRVSVSEDDGQAIVAVSDDGGGMSPKERDQLFVPFASSSGGTGLGMSITERIITQHQGRMLIDTIPERGTTVFVVVPLADREGAENA